MIKLKHILNQEASTEVKKLNEANEVEIKSMERNARLSIKYWEKLFKGKAQSAFDGIHGYIVVIRVSPKTRHKSITFSNLAKGSGYMMQNQLTSAHNVFSKVIELDPNWAEGWNKRATVLYMMGSFKLSQNDIDMVLSLEKRHFGALSGQGLVQTALQNYQKAIDSYIEAHKIYPSSQSTLQMIEQLNILIQKESI